MESIDMIVQAIATIGFPAGMCIFMFIFLNKEQESHKAEMSDLKDVISRNNEVLASLKQLIEDKLNNETH